MMVEQQEGLFSHGEHMGVGDPTLHSVHARPALLSAWWLSVLGCALLLAELAATHCPHQFKFRVDSLYADSEARGIGFVLLYGSGLWI
jgi:hypothetical protein